MKELSKENIIRHGRYCWAMALACSLFAFGCFALLTGMMQIASSDYGFLSLSGIFGVLVLAVIFAIIGYKMGLHVLLDIWSVISKIENDDYRIVEVEVVAKGGCTTCSGADNGTGIMLSDGGAFVDNTGRRITYEFDEHLYALYVGDEKYPIDVFKVSDYFVPAGMSYEVCIPSQES